jgi:hypothetical protein
MIRYKAELPQTVVGFSGTTAMDAENDYVRIDDPSIWLEFSMQSNKSTGAEGNHPRPFGSTRIGSTVETRSETWKATICSIGLLLDDGCRLEQPDLN